MKKFIVSLVVAGAVITSSSSSLADAGNSTYIGIQYAIGNYSEDGITEDFDPTVLVGRFGKFFNKNFALEGRLGIGLQDDTQHLSQFGFDGTVEIDTILGVNGVGNANISETSSVYGLIGFSRVEGTATALGFSNSDDDTGLSFGVGADLGISNNVSLNIEYVSYLSKSDFDFSTLGFGVVFDF